MSPVLSSENFFMSRKGWGLPPRQAGLNQKVLKVQTEGRFGLRQGPEFTGPQGK